MNIPIFFSLLLYKWSQIEPGGMPKIREATFTFMSSSVIASKTALNCVFVYFPISLDRFILILLQGTSWLFGTTLSSFFEPPMRLSSSPLLLKLLWEGFWYSKGVELLKFVLLAPPVRLSSSPLLLKFLYEGFWCFKRAELLKLALFVLSMKLSSSPLLLKLLSKEFWCPKEVKLMKLTLILFYLSSLKLSSNVLCVCRVELTCRDGAKFLLFFLDSSNCTI